MLGFGVLELGLRLRIKGLGVRGLVTRSMNQAITVLYAPYLLERIWTAAYQGDVHSDP